VGRVAELGSFGVKTRVVTETTADSVTERILHSLLMKWIQDVKHQKDEMERRWQELVRDGRKGLDRKFSELDSIVSQVLMEFGEAKWGRSFLGFRKYSLERTAREDSYYPPEAILCSKSWQVIGENRYYEVQLQYVREKFTFKVSYDDGSISTLGIGEEELKDALKKAFTESPRYKIRS